MSNANHQYGSYSIIIPSSTIELIPQTSTIHHHHAHSPTTTIHTSFIDFEKRADSSSSSSSRSRSRTSSTSTCDGDKQRCQTGSDIDGRTVGLAVAIPVAVFLIIIGYFIYRSYRKGKKEAETDNDPDFYGETTILPDYPKGDYDEYGNPIVHDKSFGDNRSYYSMNPLFSARLASERSINTMSNNKSPYYQNFSLPEQHHLGSKHGLDEFARQTLGTEYSGYNVSRPNSRNASKNDVSSVYKNKSPSSSTFNLQQQTQKRFAAEKSLDPTGKNANFSSKNSDIDSFNDKLTDQDTRSDIFKDPFSQEEQQEQQESLPVPISHNRQISNLSDLSFGDESEEVIVTEDANNRTILKEIQPDSIAPIEGLTIANPDQDEEDDEDIKRMKSVYRVYFDREKSVHGKNIDAEPQAVPPLPNIEDSLPEELSIPTERNVEVEEVSKIVGDEPEEEEVEQEVEESVRELPTHGHLAVDSNDKGVNHRAVSSIYSTIPLQKFDNEYSQDQQYQDQYQDQQYQDQYQDQQYQDQQYQDQQYQDQQYQDQYQDQQYQDQQYQDQQYQDQQYQYDQYQQQQYQQYPLQQQQYQQYPPQQQRSYPASSLRIQVPQFNDAEAPEVPTPSKMNYDSIVTNTEYAPTKSLTGGRRPTDIPIKPFNPIDYSEQIFHPTSPSLSNSSNFENQLNSELQQPYRDNSTPPSPHHIRQSIVMMNPVEIGKGKIFRPAGSFTQYQQNSASSSRNGSITSQSVAYSQNQNDNGYLPHSGSQADLRKQLGSSEDYNFV